MTTVPFVFGVTLTGCSFLFYLFLVIIYLRKDARYNLKNYLYRRILSFGLAGFLFEFLYFFINHYSTQLLLMSLTKKFLLLSFVATLIFWIFYVIIVVFEKNKEASAWIRKNHRGIHTYLLVAFGTISIMSLILPVDFSYNETGLVQFIYGPSIYFLYAVIVLCSVFPIPFMIKHRGEIVFRRLFAYFFILILTILSLVIACMYPSLCFITFSYTISCYLIYNRLENPDILFVRKFKKNSDRMREIREKYGFLFNMSPELRDLLNEISFMKENYLMDQKKNINKRKLESLLLDFVKSSEDGTTKQTLMDEDGVEILDLEEDVPEEMLVTKEIYSLEELQEVLKEDNLPKW
ncbi:MAG: hypothetical protein J6X28_04770 [Bacilli bacterium]|nr:hypothetical protein [Bacilli bacterium]